jgi:hypothetical protein
MRKATYRWTDDELDEIHTLASYYTTNEAIQRFKQWQKANPDLCGDRRSDRAIKYRICELRRNGLPRLDRLPIREWGKRLGIGRTQLSRALNRRPSQPRDAGITMHEIKRVLQRRPKLLNGSNLEKIAELFGEEWLNEIKIPRPGRRRPVKNLDTGEVFRSITEAHSAHYLSRTAIPKSIKDGHTAGGYHWGYLD